jgi:GWxTD domain-containing protein
LIGFGGKMKVTSKLLHFLLLFLFSFSTIWASTFNFDYAIFRGNESQNVIEVYLTIPRDMLDFVAVKEGFRSDAFIRIALSQDDNVVAMDEWEIYDEIADTTQNLSLETIPDIVVLNVPPGSYTLIVLVADLNTDQKFRQEKIIQIPTFPAAELALSDIQISNQFNRTSQSNKFSKYFGYDIMPMPSAIFGATNPMIYAFCEVYNLRYEETAPGEYEVQHKILDLDGNVVKDAGKKTKTMPGESSVEINGINIVSVPTGVYDYCITIKDLVSGQQCEHQKRFYVYKDQDLAAFERLLQQAALLDMSNSELEREFGPLEYLADKSYIDRFDQADKPQKVKMIVHFWDDAANISPIIPPLSVAEFDRRLQYANAHFATQKSQGWENDMGRVLIIYGFPSEVERHASTLNTRPYQVWNYYDLEGGVSFVFIERSGFGDMELVHSSARYETQDENWPRYIQVAR